MLLVLAECFWRDDSFLTLSCQDRNAAVLQQCWNRVHELTKCPVPCVLLFRMKYIETELKKRKGIVENEEQKVKLKNAEDSLYELPENIRVSSAKKTEEMLSNQMLSGIPEVDLGIEYVFTDLWVLAGLTG